MQNSVCIADRLYWIGGNDRRLSLFESAFPVPRGVSYNAYVLTDEKTVLFDTVDEAVSDVFFEGLEHVLAGRPLDYVVVHHMEPDHAANLRRLTEKYPSAELIVNQKTAAMICQYFGVCPCRMRQVKEGDTLETGTHILRFLFAPMVHWPEVMLTYDETSGTLFSADAFGTFGALNGNIFADELDFERDYLDEARRYYTNIVGKYGAQVQAVLKKAAGKEISMICPLHGPVWRENIGWYVGKYATWSSYQPEEKGVVIFYASVYGHTQNAAEILAFALGKAGVRNVRMYDVSVTDVSELIAEAFRFSHLVFAATTYNNGVFVNMENFLADLKAHNFRGRKFALVENGSWAPVAGNCMAEQLSAMKDMTQIGEKVTVLSSVKEEQAAALRALAETIAADLK